MQAVLGVAAAAAGSSEDRSLEFRSAVARLNLTKPDVFLECVKIALGLKEPTRSGALFGCIQDTLETKVAALQEDLFTAVEQCEVDIAALLQQTSEGKNRNAILTCVVDLCRHASDVFRARLLRFLSVVLPPLDKSALNVMRRIAPASWTVNADAAAPAHVDEHLDLVLYNMFYRLQHIMATPLTNPAPSKFMEGLIKATDVVLSAIESSRTVTTRGPSGVRPASPSDAPPAVALSYYRDPEVLLAQFTPEFDARHQVFCCLPSIPLVLNHDNVSSRNYFALEMCCDEPPQLTTRPFSSSCRC
jgi:hypothetical protein